jgi:L-ribulokinase
MAGAVAAGRQAGGHRDFAAAARAMTGLKARVYRPRAKAHRVYREIYALYRKLHDAFGTREWRGGLFDVMKRLLEIRDEARGQ